MKNLIVTLAVVMLSAAMVMLVFRSEDPPTQSPRVAEILSAPPQAEQLDSAPATDSRETTSAQPQVVPLDTLLATLYASSDLDALLAGALISQHLLDPQDEELYNSYRPVEFFALALSLNSRDPILLFALSNYCLSEGGNDRFCQQNQYLQAFSEVSGNNAITWAMRATQSYRSGDYHEIPDLLERTGQAILFTDYWPEIMLILLQAFQDAGYAASLQQAYFSASEVAPTSFLFYGDLLAMCSASTELDHSSWLSGCQSLGRIMQQGSSLMTTSIGVSIESLANQALGLEANLLARQTAEISHLSALLSKVIQQAQGDTESLRLYLDDLGRYGENESLRRAEPRLHGTYEDPP